ncbi:DUF2334 domain-containing protein [Paenibacillus koleovorans]|uniref:DUF2334 domain-containing protein n=1 Tax=Paenibacillus koleovorans TaxID=121608 RepID=UPI0013E38F29|nr:DUF2334 domain-containing protein [Paenibacillus koleovorans]
MKPSFLPRLVKKFRILLLVGLLAGVFSSVTYMSALGNDNEERIILMRLEDIGPGGQYEGPEQLGKLRAVLEMLQAHGVRYQMAIIPRWVNVNKDGARYDVSLDRQDNPYASSFVSLLKSAVAGGAVIGMHGYTHQVGDVFRTDGHQESGIGNEFDVIDVEATKTPGFAKQRVDEAIRLFKSIGLQPQFWEAPHYHTKAEQDAVFRCYFGLNYQADVQKNRNAAHPQYTTSRNYGFGESSLGSINVPTPLSYIPYNRGAEFILNQLEKGGRLPSFFYHPFLEFKHLEPVLDAQGKPVVRDGLPEYVYPAKPKSILQNLLPALQQKGYRFISINDFVPFTPGKSVALAQPMDGKNVQLADVTGDGQSDVVQWAVDRGELLVKRGAFGGYRNEPIGEETVWASIPLGAGDVWTLYDGNNDGLSDLWVMRSNGTLESYRSTGKMFVPYRSWKTGVSGMTNLVALNEQSDGFVLAGSNKERTKLEAVSVQGDTVRAFEPIVWKKKPSQLVPGDLDGDGKEELVSPFEQTSRWLQLSPNLATGRWEREAPPLELPTVENGIVRLADFNGDGAQDVLFWDRKSQTFSVYVQVGKNRFRYLSKLGPWGPTKGRLIVSDLNGDGRKDLAIVNATEPYLDTAMSWESKVGGTSK